MCQGRERGREFCMYKIKNKISNKETEITKAEMKQTRERKNKKGIKND